MCKNQKYVSPLNSNHHYGCAIHNTIDSKQSCLGLEYNAAINQKHYLAVFTSLLAIMSAKGVKMLR